MYRYAYLQLRSKEKAEDAVQESYLRYMATDADAIQSPKAFLSTVVTRLCLDQLKSARVKREAYFGPWLPEPLLTADAPIPRPAVRGYRATAGESLSSHRRW